MQEQFNHSGRVLLIEDDKVLREVISMLLMDEGYSVLQADNGQDALNLLHSLDRAQLPSCMVLDLLMPVMGGNELLRVIETQYAEEFGKIPVIICSAEGVLKKHHQVVARLEKPVSIELLCSTIVGCSVQ